MADKKVSFSKALFKGAFMYNPVLVQVVGLCPIIAATVSLRVAALLACVISFTLIVCEVLTALVFKRLANWIRVSLYMLIGIGITFPTMILLGRYDSSTLNAAGVYLPLLSVSALTAVRCEKYAVKHNTLASFYDSVSAAVGYSAVLIIVGAIREIIGNGTIGGKVLFEGAVMPGILMPFGGFVLLGFMSAALKAITTKFFPQYGKGMARSRKVSDDTIKIPSAAVTAVDLPAAVTAEDLPTAVPTEDLPAAVTAEDLPAAEPAEDLPTAEPAEDLPAAVTAEDLHAAEPADDLPTAEPADDLPEELVITDDSLLSVYTDAEPAELVEQLAEEPVAESFAPAEDADETVAEFVYDTPSTEDDAISADDMVMHEIDPSGAEIWGNDDESIAEMYKRYKVSEYTDVTEEAEEIEEEASGSPSKKSKRETKKKRLSEKQRKAETVKTSENVEEDDEDYDDDDELPPPPVDSLLSDLLDEMDSEYNVTINEDSVEQTITPEEISKINPQEFDNIPKKKRSFGEIKIGSSANKNPLDFIDRFAPGNAKKNKKSGKGVVEEKPKSIDSQFDDIVRKYHLEETEDDKK